MPPRRLIPRIPRDLETIALKCLEKNPAGRYVTAEAMADDLRRWQDGRPILARPVSPLENLWRKCCRRPVVAALTALLTLTLSIGFLVVVLLWKHAEWQRRRAEDELLFAGMLLREISAFGPRETSRYSARLLILNPDDIIAVLERTRNHIIKYKYNYPDDPSASRQLAQVDILLAPRFAARGRLVEARTLLAECLENADMFSRRDPPDSALACKFEAYSALAAVAAQEGKSEESLGHLERAVAFGQECLRLKPAPELISTVADRRWSLAQSFSRQGDEERARSLVVANLRMLDEVPKDDGNPLIVIWRTLVRLDLHQFNAGFSSTSTFRRDEADPLSRLASVEADSLDAESWAELVATSLSLRPSIINSHDKFLLDFVQLLSARASHQRRRGRLDEARRSTDRMHAFARLLVARYPRHSVAHLAVSLSFFQRAKDAWQTDDRAAVEQNWKRALDESRQALVLDPGEDARAYKSPTWRNDSTCSWRRSQAPEIRIALHGRLGKPGDDRVCQPEPVPRLLTGVPGVATITNKPSCLAR